MGGAAQPYLVSSLKRLRAALEVRNRAQAVFRFPGPPDD